MDVLIFMGQRNMQGSTGEKCNFPPDENIYEYKYLTDSLEPLTSPTGEDVTDSDGNLLLAAAALKNGSMLPYFTKEYAKTRGKTVAIHSAKGNTSISEWEKGTERFAAAVKKNVAGIKKAAEAGVINKIYVIWLQGESDAIKNTSQKEYEERLIELKNDFKKEFYFDKFCIIKTGYFAAYADWDKRSFEEKKKSDEAIMAAQEAVTNIDSDFVILTDVTAELSVNPVYLNPKEFGPHYNNAGLKIIGEAAAEKLIKISELTGGNRL